MISVIQLINVMGNKMALAPKKKPKLKGIPIGSFEAVKDAAGKMKVKPKVKRKAVSEHIRQKKSKRVRVVKGGQRP